MKSFYWTTLVVFFCLSANAVLLAQSPTPLTQKFDAYQQIYTQEKIYAETDRTLYQGGEMIWFKVWITTAKNTPSLISDKVYAELLTPKGEVLQKLLLFNNAGTAHNGFKLPTHAVGGIYTLRVYTDWMKNFDESHYFEKQLTLQKVELPAVLMKLDFEQEAYGSGSLVAAKFEARNKQNQPLAYQPIIYRVQLDGQVVATHKTYTDAQGEAMLSYTLPEGLTSNDNLLNVIIKHQGETESISRSAPIVLGNLDVQLLPEGGNLVAGYPNRVAIKVLNEFGKPADVTAILVDQKGKQLQQFSTYHQGMGAFVFTPAAEQQYHIKVLEPTNIKATYTLPKANQKSVGIFVQNNDKKSLQLDVYNPEKKPLTLLIQQQGTILLEQKISAQNQLQNIRLATSKLPVGIVQLTVFDESQNPKAERLIFVNKHRKIKTEIKTDKAVYLPRELVKVDLKVTDETGKGVRGDFSMAVVDDKNLTFADDKQDNLLSCLLLSSDLKGEVYEPNFYFDDSEIKADTALDYVLLTHGWRRYEWEQVFQLVDTMPARKLKYVKGIMQHDGFALRKQKIYISQNEPCYDDSCSVKIVETDAQGRFIFNAAGLQFPIFLNTQYKGYDVSKLIANYNSTDSTTSTSIFFPIGDFREVSGKLEHIDKTNTPKLCRVYLWNANRQQFVDSTYTDMQGRFIFDNMPYGAYAFIIPSQQKNADIYRFILYPSQNVYTKIVTTNLDGILKKSESWKKQISSTLMQQYDSLPSVTRYNYSLTRIDTSAHYSSNKQVGKNNTYTIAPRHILRTLTAEEIRRFGYVNSAPSPTYDVIQPYRDESLGSSGSRHTSNETYIDGARVVGDFGAAVDIDVAALPQTEFADAATAIASESAAPPMDTIIELVQVPTKSYSTKESGKELYDLYSTHEMARPTPTGYTTDITYKAKETTAFINRFVIASNSKRFNLEKYSAQKRFYAPKYQTEIEKEHYNTDNRTTLYWNASIRTDATGKNTKPIQYYNADGVTTYQITVNGIGQQGELAAAQQSYTTQVPFEMLAALPTLLTQDDEVQVAVQLHNNTHEVIEGKLSVNPSDELSVRYNEEEEIRIEPNSTTIVTLPVKAMLAINYTSLRLSFVTTSGKSQTLNFRPKIKERGFSRSLSFAKKDSVLHHSFVIGNYNENSLESHLTINTNIFGELLESVAGILQEPHGCFEQVSSSNYPNILALQLLQKAGATNPKIEIDAHTYLKNGYEKLVQYEIEGGGFDWFGHGPAHEGLTAYGLAQFEDMKAVYPAIDEAMIDRTKAFLLSRKDGKGGFLQNKGKYGFSGERKAVFDAYITWALTKSGVTDLELELQTNTTLALASKDLYLLSLMALANQNVGNKKEARQLADAIKKVFAKKALSKINAAATLTNSGGNANHIETISWAGLALLQTEQHEPALLNQIADDLMGYKQYGRYGNSQSTVLALQYLVAFQPSTKELPNPVQEVLITINGQKAIRVDFGKTNRQQINESIVPFLKKGKNTIQVSSLSGQAVWVNLKAKWYVDAPESNKQCALQLKTKLEQPKTELGNTVRLAVRLQNKTNTVLSSPMAIIGIPAGASLQPWQLKQLQEERVFDYYEIKDNLLYLYFDQMDVRQVHQIGLDLKTETTGNFAAPASCAYLYYTDEYKHWVASPYLNIH